MTVFGTDSRERTIIPILVAGLSIGLAWLASLTLEALHISVPWFLDAPSPFLMFGVLYAAFDRWLWASRVVRRAGLVAIPDLRGRWTGVAHQEGDDPIDIEVDIEQSWRSINVALRTVNSRSTSTVAAIRTAGPGPQVLTYQYLNEPTPGAPENLQIHRGTASLDLSSSAAELEGEYYTGRGRRTVGTITLRRL